MVVPPSPDWKGSAGALALASETRTLRLDPNDEPLLPRASFRNPSPKEFATVARTNELVSLLDWDSERTDGVGAECALESPTGTCGAGHGCCNGASIGGPAAALELEYIASTSIQF